MHQVYVDFICQVRELAARQGRRTMFWGDIVLHEPKLIQQLPKDLIALNWGYEAEHPFDAETRQFSESGLEFYVCPGTSSWCSIAGRTDNMLANQCAAAQAGLAHRASGYLNTDWGDYGHLQYLPLTYAGLAAGGDKLVLGIQPGFAAGADAGCARLRRCGRDNGDRRMRAGKCVQGGGKIDPE